MSLVDVEGKPLEEGGGLITLTDDDQELDEVTQAVASSLPKPSGYKLLIALPEIDEVTDGGIVKPLQAIQNESLQTVVGFVISMGPDAYKDEVKFPSGPYCKKGDFVLFRPYSGSRISVFGKEFRFINDDTVEGTVEDPRGITRAG